MTRVVLIAALGVLVVLIVVLLAVLVKNWPKDISAWIKHYRNDVVVSGGVDIITGRLTDGKNTAFENDASTLADTVMMNPGGANVLAPARHEIVLRSSRNAVEYKARFSSELYIGRANVSKYPVFLVISGDPTVSSTQCMIFEYKNSLYIRDLNSKNHTYLNGKKIADTVRLGSSGTLKLGKIVYKYQAY